MTGLRMRATPEVCITPSRPRGVNDAYLRLTRNDNVVYLHRYAHQHLTDAARPSAVQRPALNFFLCDINHLFVALCGPIMISDGGRCGGCGRNGCAADGILHARLFVKKIVSDAPAPRENPLQGLSRRTSSGHGTQTPLFSGIFSHPWDRTATGRLQNPPAFSRTAASRQWRKCDHTYHVSVHGS